MKLPSFFSDDSTTFKVEEVIDYFLSWTIRCADDAYSENKLVNQYAKMILSKLVFNNQNSLNNRKVRNIQTWKQWRNIDICVQLEIDDQKLALIIENKMYSSIRENQLQKYKQIAEDFYVDRPEYELNFIFIRPDYEHENKYNEKDVCLNQGYNYFNIVELQELLPNELTNNQLFDEFWFDWR